MAADVPPMTIAMPTAVAPAPGFAWAGPYVGAMGSVNFCGGYCWGLVGGQFGNNWVSGAVLTGLEVQAGAWFSGDIGGFTQINARLGYILGNAVVYAEVGIGNYWPGLGGDGPYADVGGGVEFGLGPSLSIFGEVKFERVFFGADTIRTEAGLNFHIGN